MPDDDTPRPASSTSSHTRSDADEALSLEDAFAQGRLDGADGAPTDVFDRFAESTAERQRLAAQERALADRAATLKDRLESVEALRRTVAATTAEAEALKAKKSAAEDRLDETEQTLEAVDEEQRRQKARGSLLYGLLYAVAGLLFVAGDVVMSREIVANALKLSGTVEPWIFAIGLAMLAVLLKPAYDRLVEKPYWNERPGAFAGVIGVCALGALATLGVLGAFRSTAFVSNAQIQRRTAELMDATDPAAISQLQQEIGAIQQELINSPLGFWAFVLSGVLFALAGAVCLGIGLQHLRDAYHIRLPLYRRRRTLEAERSDAQAARDEASDRLAALRPEHAKRRQHLADQPSLDVLREQLDEVRDALYEVRDERARLRRDQWQALYRRGYALAEAGAPSPSSPPQGDGAAPASGSSDSADRPHRALRHLLRRNARDT